MLEPDDMDKESPDTEELLDLGESGLEDDNSLDDHGLHLITLMYDTKANDVPSLDLGDCPPWIAITLLQSAIDTLQMLIPPVDVSFNGRVVVSSSMEMLGDLDDDD
jgi:hypothetical protein